MAGRPIKQGLDFFFFDVDFFRDIKMRKIAKACGSNAYAVIICLLCNIYRDRGYYILWDNDLPFVIADEVGVSEGCVQEIITKAIQVGFFNQEKFSELKVLTSDEVQRRFFRAASKRKEIDLREEYVINSSELGINSELIQLMTNKFGNNSINDVDNRHSNSNSNSNSNKSLSLNNDSNAHANANVERNSRERENFFKIFFFKNARNPEAEVTRFVSYYQAIGWKRGGVEVTDREALAQMWEIKEAGRFPDRFLKIWEELYDRLEGIEAARPELGRMLSEIARAEMRDGAMILTVTAGLEAYIERSSRILRPILMREGLNLMYITKKFQ